jgi:hypothetical protein
LRFLPRAAPGATATVSEIAATPRHRPAALTLSEEVGVSAGARRSKNSSSRFRFRPLYRGAFGFRLQPLGGASTYLRSLLDAGGLSHTQAEPAIGDFTDFRVGKAAAVGPSSLALAEKDAGGGIDEPPTRLLARKEGRGTGLGAPPVASRAPLIELIASASVRSRPAVTATQVSGSCNLDWW